MCTKLTRECFLTKNFLLVFDTSNPIGTCTNDRTGGTFLAWIYCMAFLPMISYHLL